MASLKVLRFFACFLLIWSFQSCYGQILDTFDFSLNPYGWYSEGDGQYSIDTLRGNPAPCFEVRDNATGDLNIAIAPARYLGNWSATDENDSIGFDLFISSTRGYLANAQPVFEILGPGGKAVSLLGLNPPKNIWDSVGIRLDSNLWKIEYGTWNSLLSNVTQFRVRAEYINGTETNYFDNFYMSFSPGEIRKVDTFCSSFDSSSLEGWRFEGAGAIKTGSQLGNPEFGITIGDRSGQLSQLIAPPVFLGNWTELDSNSTLGFDMQISTGSSTFFNKDYLVQLSGNNSSAIVNPVDSIVKQALNQWHRFEFPIDTGTWTVTSGTFDSLLENVEEIRLKLEFINGGELIYFDNFCLQTYKDTVITRARKFEDEEQIQIFPNPNTGSEIQVFTSFEQDQITLFSMEGKIILNQKVQGNLNVLNLSSSIIPGIYLIRINNRHTEKLVIR